MEKPEPKVHQAMLVFKDQKVKMELLDLKDLKVIKDYKDQKEFLEIQE